MKLRLGIRAKLFGVSLVLIALVALPSTIYLEHNLRGWLIERIRSELTSHAQTARVAVEALGAPTRVARADGLADRLGEASGARVTIIATDGKVLGDSELSQGRVREAASRAERPEVRQALVGGLGVANRYSETLGRQMVYVAVPYAADGRTGVVRASLPLAEVDESIGRVRALLLLAAGLGLAVAIFMSGLASALASRTLGGVVMRARELVRGHDRASGALDAADDDLGGLTTSIHALSRELTETLDDLAAERDRLEAILDAMSEALVVVDAHQRITLANPAAVDLLDLPVGQHGYRLVERVRAPALHELVEAARRGERPANEFDLPEPTARRVLARAAPERSSGGAVIVMYDVTELRRLERVRRDFVANVSHELRTPISIIRANAETLQGGAIDDPEHAPRFLEAIARNSERLSAIIGDLLDISRLEAGHYNIELASLDLRQAVERAMSAVEPRAHKRDQTLVDAVDAGVRIEADPKALDQVLLNLLSNAVKYAGAGARVEVSARPVGAEAGGDRLRVEVSDDGPGIPHKDYDRIFERFYRVDAGRAREAGGSGLGLSIVKHLVQEMGGTVGFEPNDPRGAVFWFELGRS